MAIQVHRRDAEEIEYLKISDPTLPSMFFARFGESYLKKWTPVFFFHHTCEVGGIFCKINTTLSG